MATCFALRRTDTGVQHALATPFVTPSGFGPADLDSAYKLSATGGSGQTVGIVDAMDDPTAESDLATYRSQFGLPACTTANGCFKKVNQNGAASPLPASDAGWAGEISLDVDMVSAICPQCHILLVEASSATIANLGASVNRAVALGAKYVSNSYGGGESGDPTNDANFYHHAGVAVTASTGDGGFGISYPASSPFVTAVGGTSLTTAANARGWSETAWSGAGSGCSVDEAKPSFQANVTTGCTRRANADVSAVADPNTGVAVFQTFGATGWQVYGGTSVSSPIIASVYALAGTPGATDTPAAYPYSHTGNLFDVTSGSNGACTTTVQCHAGVGWDGPTGLGTPNGTAAFTAGAAALAINNPGSRTGTVGTAASLQLSASGGTAPYTFTTTGLPTGLSTSSSGLISGTPTTAGTFTVTATVHDSAAGTASTSFTWTINAVGAGCSAPGQKLGNPGFESGNVTWSATPAVIGANGPSEPAHAGTFDAWMDGYGTTHTDTVSQTVTIPSGCSATLSFFLHIDTAETTTTTQFDKLTVKLGTTTLGTFSNLNKAAGYASHSFNVSSFAGQTVTLTFTGTEDVSLQTSFVLDDTALTAS
ncbi:MAG TPA: putative Ig domain-containing protein [Pseudonocardiaceae bacterium]|nr:putative Ig domain-containing protein [Pseudonocardiaceae bacterium]